MSSAPNATMLHSSTPIQSSQIASRTQAWRELGGIVSGRRFHGVDLVQRQAGHAARLSTPQW